MTREESKEFYPVLQAFAEGRVIECRTKPSSLKGSDTPNGWTEMKKLDFWPNTEYRIKPEPKYRPFNNAEECWNEMLKHQPFGWVNYKDFRENIAAVMRTVVTLADNEGRNYTFEHFFENYTFADGTPFGVKEEK